MKVIKYICDKCSKETDEIFEVNIAKFDPVNEGDVIDLSEDMMSEVLDIVMDKHLCKNCALRGLRMAYTPVATVNKDFEKEVAKMINEASPEKLEQLKEKIKKAPVTIMPAEQPSVEVVNDNWCNLTKEELEPMCEAGMTVQEIADKTGYNYMQIWRKVKRYGLKFNSPDGCSVKAADQDQEQESTPEPEEAQPKTESGFTLENVKRLYAEEGKDILTISKELDVPINDVRQFIVKNRIFKNKDLRNKYDKMAAPQSLV